MSANPPTVPPAVISAVLAQRDLHEQDLRAARGSAEHFEKQAAEARERQRVIQVGVDALDGFLNTHAPDVLRRARQDWERAQ